MQSDAAKYARLKMVDGVLFEELINCGRDMRPYPGHAVIARKIGFKSEAAVASAITRLEHADLIRRENAGRRTCAFIICASGRRIDYSGASAAPMRRRPARGGYHAR